MTLRKITQIVRRGHATTGKLFRPRSGTGYTTGDYYMAARLQGLIPGCAAYRCACASLHTNVGCARAMFAPEARAAYAAKGVVLPNLDGFLNAKICAKVAYRVQPPPEERVIAAHAALAELAHGNYDENLFIVTALPLHSGLVRHELIFAHSDWLQAPNLLHVMPGQSHEREVPLPDWLFARLAARRPGFLLDGGFHTRAASCIRGAKWLRAHGSAGVKKPLWELRVFYAGFLCSKFPALVVKARLGHHSVETTMKHFSINPYDSALLALWNKPLRSVPSAPAAPLGLAVPPVPAVGPLLPILPATVIASIKGTQTKA